jgi:cobalt-zinc-cadmium efflux system outer membrane protein
VNDQKPKGSPLKAPRATARLVRGRRLPLLAVALSCSIAGGCARYHARPISPSQTLEDFQARRLDAPELDTFLVERGEVSGWPPRAWSLHDLTLAAFYYSPALDVARAQWAVARGGVITAGGRPNPSVSGGTGYNVTTPRSEITPWIPEASLDIPIEVAGKRGIRIAAARQRSDAARLNIISAAWQVRSRVRQAFIGLYVARQADSLLAVQREIRNEALTILESRRAAGEASPTEVTQGRVALAESRVAALDAAQAAVKARSDLADAVGIPPSALDSVSFDFGELTRAVVDIPEGEARLQALLHRSDILASLAEYEASQRDLQLEVRKQYPDISLGPGYQLDQTDIKWTLLVSFSLPLLNRNQGPIAEAAAKREEAAAGFVALQSKVLGEVEGAVASARAAVTQVQAADTMLDALGRQEATAKAAFDVGEISRLDLLGLQAEAVATALARLDALSRAQTALGALEDAMQTPLDMEKWTVDAPRRGSGSGGGAR